MEELEDLSSYKNGFNYFGSYPIYYSHPHNEKMGVYRFPNTWHLENFFVGNFPFLLKEKIKTKVIGETLFFWKLKERTGPDGLPPMSKPETESYPYPAA